MGLPHFRLPLMAATAWTGIGLSVWAMDIRYSESVFVTPTARTVSHAPSYLVSSSYVAPTAYVATAYSLRGRTASGQMVAKGVIAADPRHLPLGSRVRIEAGPYSGEYVVADTGGMVRGRRIDIWTPSTREAMRFGKRMVKLTVLSLGGRKRATRT